MKGKSKKVVLPLIIVSILLLSIFIVYNIEKRGDASGINNGVYKGIGTGFRGEMTVEVTVKNEQINKIEVTETVDDAKWFNRASNTIIPEIISLQTVNVDTVSGATYSSMGIKEAVANALINAGGKNVKAVVNDLPETD